MKKVVVFGLCFLIVLCSFVVSFASYSDVPSPVIVPQSSDHISSMKLFGTVTGGYDYYFYSNDYPVYVIFYGDENSTDFRWTAFSESDDAIIYRWRSDNDTVLSDSLSNQYNGYYFTSGNLSTNNFNIYPEIYNVPYNTPVSDIIDSVSSSVFGTTFDLSYITHGAVSWLSAVVDGVLQEPLLLFLILSSLSGIAIGLLFRFKRG